MGLCRINIKIYLNGEKNSKIIAAQIQILLPKMRLAVRIILDTSLLHDIGKVKFFYRFSYNQQLIKRLSDKPLYQKKPIEFQEYRHSVRIAENYKLTKMKNLLQNLESTEIIDNRSIIRLHRGLENLNKDDALKYLGMLHIKLSRYSDYIDHISLGDIISCLKYLLIFTSESEVVRGYIKLVSSILQNLRNMKCDLRGLSPLHFLCQMSCKHIEIRHYLFVCTTLIRSQDRFHSHASMISSALMGLQMMSSDTAEVRSLLSALVIKIQSENHVFTAMELSYCVFGLQNMTTDSIEVQELLSVLTEKFDTCPYMFSCRDISMSAFGIRRMQSSCPVIRKLVLSIASKIDESADFMDASNVVLFMQAIRNMGSDVTEVVKLLDAFTRKLDVSTCLLNRREMHYAMQGLQKMNDSVLEVKALRSLLYSKAVDII